MRDLFERLARLLGLRDGGHAKGPASEDPGRAGGGDHDPGRIEISEPPPALEEGRSRHATRPGLYLIGLDFGTSGTKVAIRDLMSFGSPPTIVDMGTKAPGFVRFALPSEVRMARGRMIMGRPESDPAGSTEGWLLPSPKSLLLHPREEMERALEGMATIPDEFEWRTTPTRAEGLASLFLAEVLRGANQIIRATAPSGERKVMVNLGVPVDRLDQSTEARHFQRALDAAVLMAEEFDHPESAERAFLQWREVLLHLKKNPPAPETRRGNLVAEAQAAMMGMGTALRLESGGLYAIMDAGAATTDMGIFRYTRFPDREIVGFYASRSVEGGCDAIDRSTARAVLGQRAAGPDEMLRLFREARARGVEAGWPQSVLLGEDHFELGEDHVDTAVDELGEVISERYSRLWGEAYSKEKNTDEWRVLRTLVVGGGSLIPRLTARLLRKPRDLCAVAEVSLASRVKSRVAGASADLPTGEEFPFLFVALGLCGLPPEMPDLFTPSRIEPVKPIGQEPTGVYQYEWDNLYSK